MSIQTGDNRFSEATWIVNQTSGYGTHTTIQDAIDDASSGDSIAVFAGTYTEDLTLKPGVRIFSPAYGYVGPANILGSHTSSSDGNYSFQNIYFETNGGTIFTHTTTTGTLVLKDCFINLTDGDGMTINGSTANVEANNCYFVQSADNLDYFNVTGAVPNGVVFRHCTFSAVQSVTAGLSTCSSGSCVFFYCNFHKQGFSASGSTWMRFIHCYFNGNGDFTYYTTSGTAALHAMEHCHLESGASSAVVVGAGTTLRATNVTVRSSAGSPISVAGTLNTTYTTY